MSWIKNERNQFLFTGAALVASTLLACQSTSHKAGDRFPALAAGDRGSVAEYDSGPSKDSKWPDLFAETPDYRSYGAAVYEAAAKKAGIRDDGQEKFRWKVGPMWYRGRLTPESVKVFVVGQEGAQDENTSNRTFTGSTGTKMQNFINYLGITESYLFMNTFSYTITGQYGERPEPTDSEAVKKQKAVFSNALMWMAQNPDSVIVQHRHKMFDYMLENNKKTLSLIIGVGSAGKDSVATWIRSHGGKCTSRQLTQSFCRADEVRPGAIAIGVRHPGGASARNGGDSAAQALRAEFAQKAKLVAEMVQKNPQWLKPDTGARTNFSKGYFYADAPIPHKDFAFGSIWRLGKDGTTTNRRGADGIQIYSEAGCYNNAIRLPNGRCDFGQPPKTVNLKYDEPKDLKSSQDMAREDLPWESPKSKLGRRLYDEGPGEFATVLMGQGKNRWPDFKSLGVTQHESFGYGPIYRGNLKNAEVLVLADQESHDDMFSTRAFTGTGGQKFQSLLNSMGVQGKYAIIRTLPVDTLDLPMERVKEIALNREVINVRNEIFNAILSQGKTKLIITVGAVAAEAIKTVSAAGVPVINLEPADSKTADTQWQKALSEASSMNIFSKSIARFDGSLTAIPREDLPVHTRWWMGTSGSRGSRAFVQERGQKVYSGDYYKFDAPTWVSSRNYPASSSNLGPVEKESIKKLTASNLESAPNEVTATESED